MKHRLLAFALAAAGAPLVLLGQESAVPVQETSDSVFSLLTKGGPVMIPLAICSIVALTLAFERFISLSRPRVLPPHFQETVRNTIRKDGKLHWRHGMELCEEVGAPLAKVFRTAIHKRASDPQYQDKAMSDTAALEVGRLRRSLRGLKIIAAVSPLLGLLGTVAGMIRSFQTVAASTGSLGRAEMLAQGIYEAMVTTATGLTVAIPTLVVYSFLYNRVDKLADEIELEGGAFADFTREVQNDPTLTAAADTPATTRKEDSENEYTAL